MVQFVFTAIVSCVITLSVVKVVNYVKNLKRQVSELKSEVRVQNVVIDTIAPKPVDDVDVLVEPAVVEEPKRVENTTAEPKRVDGAKAKRVATSNVIDLAGLDSKKAYDKAWRKAKAMGLDGKVEGKACVAALSAGATSYVVGGKAIEVEKVEVKSVENVKPEAKAEVKPEVKATAKDDAKKAYDFGWRKAKAQGADSEGCKASGKKAAEMVKSGMTLDEVKAAFGVTPKAPKAKVENVKPVETAPVVETPAEPEAPKAYEWKNGEKGRLVSTGIILINNINSIETANKFNDWFEGLQEEKKNYLRSNEKFQAAHKAAEGLIKTLKNAEKARKSKTTAQQKNEEIKKAKENAKKVDTKKEETKQVETAKNSVNDRKQMFTASKAIAKAMTLNEIKDVELNIPAGNGNMTYTRLEMSKDGNILIFSKTKNQKNESKFDLDQRVAMVDDPSVLGVAIMRSIGKMVNEAVVNSKKVSKTA